MIPWCAVHGTGVIVDSPAASGLLADADLDTIAAAIESTGAGGGPTRPRSASDTP